MTLYASRMREPNEAKIPALHALIIGVGEYQYLPGGMNEEHRAFDFALSQLTSSVHAALGIAQWFETRYHNPACPLGSIELLLSKSEAKTSAGENIEEANLENTRRAVREWKARCDENEANIALFYFAGHGISNSAESQYLLLSDFAAPHRYWSDIDFQGFLIGMNGHRARTQFFFVDACRSIDVAMLAMANPGGESFEDGPVGVFDHPKKRFTYYAAGPGGQAYGPPGDITTFARALLQSLDGAAAVKDKSGQKVVTARSLASSLDIGETRSIGDVPLHYPDRPQLPDSRPLEEALGYATQAFREYLNKNIVQGVELIYFLSYDVWDGCLLYDGLVSGSIEQRLLNYIRREFLDRDRLRSRYEELENDKREYLGAAGECFKRANELAGENPVAEPIERLWYIGDLANYGSEYREYDRLLGLVSCLYIPIVGDLLPRIPQSDRPPRGGVLMAASRISFGLKPWGEDVKKEWQQAKEANRENPAEDEMKEASERDKEVSRKIVDRLKVTGHKSEIIHFLKCIAGMYSQKSKSRSQLRRTMHPTFAKAVANDLKRSNEVARTEVLKAVEQIGMRVSSFEERQQDAQWLKHCMERIGAYDDIAKRIPPGYTLKKLYWSYRLPCVWRDFKIEELEIREKRKSANGGLSGDDVIRQDKRLDEITRALNVDLKDAEFDETLEQYIVHRSEPYTRYPVCSAGFTDRSANAHQCELVDNLIDDLRECPEGPFQIFSEPFRKLAPLDPYVEGIEEVEGLLANVGNKTHLYQFAHTLQIWMLGAWILQQKMGQRSSVGEQILKRIHNYFQNNYGGQDPKREKWEDLGENWGTPSPEIVDSFWSLIAASHDIATPLQSFQDWCRGFFLKYFSPKTVARFDLLPVLLDVFHDPRFPFHKSAITNLYPSEESNWLESMFHVGLSSRIDHALAGSLILMREISPEQEQRTNNIWSAGTDHLQKFKNDKRPERELVMPAYLAHAVAFSHLANMKWDWDMYLGRPADPRHRHNPPEYFKTTAQNFNIKFDEFPLTYLLGLLEALLEPEDESWLLSRCQKHVFDLAQIKDKSPALTSFYIESIQWLEHRQELVLRLTLWEADRQLEKQVACTAANLKRLTEAFNGPDMIKWIVYEPDKFKREFELFNDGYAPLSPLEYALPSTTYNLLRMKLRLDEFRKYYRGGADFRFAIQFSNVSGTNADDKMLIVSLT